jgi:energy-coupling factor transporter ATP-binding protein EcfA2
MTDHPANPTPATGVASRGTDPLRHEARTPAPLRLFPSDHPGRQRAKVLGVSDAGAHRAVALKVADARHHTHIVGATGSGKSTLLVNLILADAIAGRGVVVLDPKGDLVTDVLARLPEPAGERLVLLDPAEQAAPAALNVLDVAGRDPELVVDHLVGVFHRLYAAYWGPRSEDVLRSACLTLTRRPGTTLAHVPLLLANPRYRAALTKGLSDPAGLGGFWSWYDGLSDAGQAQVIGPVMNKLRAVLTRRFAADLLGSAQSTFSLAKVLDGGILLARLPKGVLGDDTCRLVGSLLLAGIWQAATARAAQPEAVRLDAAVYVDECHNFLHLPGSVDDVLAEARGYHLALTLAHQHLGQLGKELADGVAANARNKVFFTTSPDDARTLARHVGPYLNQADLCHLDRYQAAVRLVVDGRDTTGFTLATRAAPAIGSDHTGALRAAARRRGRDAQARHAERLARRWTPDTDTDEDTDSGEAAGGAGSERTGGSVSVPVSVPVCVPVSLPVSETGTETGTLEDAERHVSGRFPEIR